MLAVAARVRRKRLAGSRKKAGRSEKKAIGMRLVNQIL